ncbi:MAG: hypothetical protein V4726_05195 [Verrucomicrobiota bacterium]
MKRYLCAPLAFAVILAVPAAAELQPRKIPAAPAEAPPVPAAPAVPKTTPGPAKPAPAPALTEEGEPKLSPELSAKLLKQLDEVEKGLGGKRGSESIAMMKLLKEAGGSNEKAFNLWQDSTKEVDFDQKGKTATEFMDWKRTKAKDLAINDNFCASIRLQAQFLALALLDSHAETPAQRLNVMTEANLYLDAVAKACDKHEGLAKSILASIMDVALDPDREVTMSNLEESLKQVREAAAALGGDIMESLLAKNLKPESCIGNHVISAKNPGNLDEIYEQLVMRPLRDKKDSAGLAAAWNRRISQTAALAKATKVKELTERYSIEKLPVLKWLQARDQWRSGQAEAGAASMLTVIRENPGHKACPEWMSELRNMATAQ